MNRYHFQTLYQVAVFSRTTSEVYASVTVLLRNLWKLHCDLGVAFSERALILSTTKINQLFRNLKGGCMYERTRAHVHTHTHTHTHINTLIHTHIHIHIHTHTLQTHIHTHIHTHTHTQNADLVKLLNLIFLLAQPPPVGHGLLIHEVSRPHTTTHHSR